MTSRRENDDLQKDYPVPFAYPSVSATTTRHIFKARVACRVTRIEHCNPVGLAEDAANTFKGEIKNGSTVLSTLFDTDSDLAGANSLVANAHSVASLSAVASALNLAAGDTLDLVLTEQGTAVLPEGYGLVYVTEI